MRIRTRLLALVLAVLLPAIVVAGFAIVYVYREERANFENSMRETTRALALLLDNEFQSQEGLVRALSTSPILDTGDYATFYAHARAAVAGTDSNITLTDTEGRQFLNTHLPFDRLLARPGRFTELRRRHGAMRPLVSDLYYSDVTRRYGYAVQLPVLRNGRLLHYIEIGTPAAQLQSLFVQQNLPEGWIGTIVDRKGLVAARTVEPGRFVGQQAPQGFRERLVHSSEGVYDGLTLTGVPASIFYSQAPLSEWTFAISVPQEQMDGPALRASVLVGTVAFLVMALGILGAIAVARGTAYAIEGLRRSAEELGRGGRAAPRRYGIREIDAASAAMSWASDEIHSHRAQLEQRVADAVARAEQSQRALLQAQKLEALGRLTGGIAHDFNNVLQTLTSGLQLASLSSTDQRVRALLEPCQRAVKRAVDLTRQLMVFARVQDARLETIDMARQLQAALPLLKGGLPSNIDCRLDASGGLWPVTVDTLQLELALLNLTMNARDAMPEGGVLRIGADNVVLAEEAGDLAAGRYVRVTVADSGVGMSPEVLARAVDPFFTTKGVGRGTGMGLAQAYGFGKQSGGALVLRSRPGEGTVASLYLPAATMPAAHAEHEERMVERAAQQGRILFVEDDALVRDVVAPALRTAGFEVDVADSGDDALARLESGRLFDVVFSDVVMPGKLGGIELAQLTRARFPGVAVVLATGYSDRRVDLEGVRVLAKPYEMDAVVRLLNEALQEA